MIESCAMLLLTWTPYANQRARIYRNAKDTWTVLIRDIVYDGSPRARYVSQQDFDLLSQAEIFAKGMTGHKATIQF